jgi:hypothetical protein
VNVGGHTRIAKSADENGVEPCGQHGEAIRRDGNVVGEIAVGSPVECGRFDGSPSGLDDADRLRDNFFSDAVAGNHGNTLLRSCGHAGNVSTGLKCS